MRKLMQELHLGHVIKVILSVLYSINVKLIFKLRDFEKMAHQFGEPAQG